MKSTLRYKLLVLGGGLPMLAAVAIEVMAVLGRAITLPLPGSVELVQVLVLISGIMAMIVATLNGSHAKVRLILDRLNTTHANSLLRVNHVLASLFFLLLFIGSAWLLADLWAGFEESEVWQVPYRPLRILAVLGTLLVAGLFLRLSLRGEA
ncbi:MAG TPA: TRAP transporter small permease subunit [Pseudomonadaceae bacterium]|nr:TRAP transporter small permease subunit [Pseudomonadaceae bacterium]